MPPETDFAEQLAEQARQSYSLGDFEHAADLFEQAEAAFMTSQSPHKASEMANNQSVALLQGGDPKGALKAAEGTEAIFAAEGNVKYQAMALSNQAAAHEALGHLDQALILYQQSSDLLKEIADTDARPFVLKRLSAIQMRKGRFMQGLATMDTSLTISPHLTLSQNFLKKLLQVPLGMVSKQ